MANWVARHQTMLHAQFDRLDAYLAAQKGKATR
jgi:hypothetical protein